MGNYVGFDEERNKANILSVHHEVLKAMQLLNIG